MERLTKKHLINPHRRNSKMAHLSPEERNRRLMLMLIRVSKNRYKFIETLDQDK